MPPTALRTRSRRPWRVCGRALAARSPRDSPLPAALRCGTSRALRASELTTRVHIERLQVHPFDATLCFVQTVGGGGMGLGPPPPESSAAWLEGVVLAEAACPRAGENCPRAAQAQYLLGTIARLIMCIA